MSRSEFWYSRDSAKPPRQPRNRPRSERMRPMNVRNRSSYLEREDMLRERYDQPGYDPGYMDEPFLDYDSDDYNSEYEPGPEYPLEPDQPSDHDLGIERRNVHDRWARQRNMGVGMGMGMDSGASGHWRDRDGDYEAGLEAQYPEQDPWGDEEGSGGGYYPQDYYVSAPEYYRERYLPEEDSLQRIYERMFKNIDYNIKVPVMQLIATGALFFIFILNYTINEGYVIALGNFSPWVAIQPPWVAAFLAAVFGIFLYIFPTIDRDIKRTVVIGTIILFIFFFGGPALLAGAASSGSSTAVGEAFASTIIEFLKLAAILVYWAPMFLGIYGIWARNSFYIGASAMFLFLIIIILDIYLLYEGLEITKYKEQWPLYAFFAILLFCYIEMSDSAITFANFTSVSDLDEIDPGYYDHLDRIIQKYFVYFILFVIFLLILGWMTLSFDGVLRAFGSTQTAESLELNSIYGIIFSLVIIGIIIIFIGLFIRNEESFKSVFRKFAKILPSMPAKKATIPSNYVSYPRSRRPSRDHNYTNPDDHDARYEYRSKSMTARGRR